MKKSVSKSLSSIHDPLHQDHHMHHLLYHLPFHRHHHHPSCSLNPVSIFGRLRISDLTQQTCEVVGPVVEDRSCRFQSRRVDSPSTNKQRVSQDIISREFHLPLVRTWYLALRLLYIVTFRPLPLFALFLSARVEFLRWLANLGRLIVLLLKSLGASELNCRFQGPGVCPTR